MPPYFYFLTLMALRVFREARVDVAVLEVGLGGRWDATNVVPAPAVCAITALGYDHMEILGSTLTLIAGEKAGILKAGVPAITCPQPDEAAAVLRSQAQLLQAWLAALRRPLLTMCRPGALDGGSSPCRADAGGDAMRPGPGWGSPAPECRAGSAAVPAVGCTHAADVRDGAGR